jgi:hypothetical protein
MDSLSLLSLSVEEPSRDLVELLPRDASWRVFSFVPVDERLLLNTVCRSWRAAVREPSVWRELDFSRSTRHVTEEMIHAALRYARGQLRVLDVSETHLPFEALLEIARINVVLHTLRLCACGDSLLQASQVDALLAVAPRLQTLQCIVKGEPQEMLPLLRKERQYESLIITRAVIMGSNENAPAEVDVLPLAAAAAA